MAQVTAVFGAPHTPFHYRATQAPREEWSEPLARMVELGELMGDKLAAARPDAIVVIGNDHFHQFFHDNMPAFIVGKMPTFDGIFHNETREFGHATCSIPGDARLATELIAGGMARGVDFATSDAMRLDHAIVTPLLHFKLLPKLDVPIVPILTNCLVPPMPPARRFYEVGQAVREVIDGLGDYERVAVVASGNLSLEVGGPRQFVPEAMDAGFDETVSEYLANGEAGKLIDFCSFERMTQAGNVTHAVTNYIMGMALAEGLDCTLADPVRRPGSSQAFFGWESKSNVRSA